MRLNFFMFWVEILCGPVVSLISPLQTMPRSEWDFSVEFDETNSKLVHLIKLYISKLNPLRVTSRSISDIFFKNSNFQLKSWCDFPNQFLNFLRHAEKFFLRTLTYFQKNWRNFLLLMGLKGIVSIINFGI